MTADDARALFDAALDGELDADARAEFEAELAANHELREEYERHRSLFAATEALGRVSQVDLLAGVQHKLRARSGGKFYRDRFAERRGQSASLGVVLVVSAGLVIGVLLWFAYSSGLFAR
jgi:anti-sigma factor RsiW